MELQELMEHFFHLYGRRNRVYLPGLRERIDFLNLAIGDLQEAVRKVASAVHLEVALARVTARIFCLAEHFSSLPLVSVMAQKYPASRCSYCGNSPCSCPEVRPEVKLERAANPAQLHWSLSEWCHHLANLYGPRNRAKGIESVLNRLFKEVSELLSLQMQIPYLRLPPEEVEREFALELADALAWTIAVADLVGVNLENAVLSRYGAGCSKCHQNPCVCLNFNVVPVRWPQSY